MSENTEFQDQGSLDQPAQATDQPLDTSGGAVDPVADEHLTNPEAVQTGHQSLSEQEAPAVDDTSASTLAQVNEAREAGEPLDGSLNAGGQPAATPAGTGASAAPAAGTATTT